VHSNGRLSELEDPLQAGAVYHLEPRLCGGKGGEVQEIDVMSFLLFHVELTEQVEKEINDLKGYTWMNEDGTT